MSDRSVILEVVVDAVVRTVIVFALFLLFSGHNAPGGGFIAGLVFGAGLILCYLARGAVAMRRLLRARPDTLLGSGLLVAVLVGMAGGIWGSGFLDGGLFTWGLPVVGEVKFATAVVFDVGVFAIVVGLVAVLVGAFDDEEDPA